MMCKSNSRLFIVLCIVYLMIAGRAANSAPTSIYYYYDETESQFNSLEILLEEGIGWFKGWDRSVSFRTCPAGSQFVCFISWPPLALFSAPRQLFENNKITQWYFFGLNYRVIDTFTLTDTTKKVGYLIEAEPDNPISWKPFTRYQFIFSKDVGLISFTRCEQPKDTEPQEESCVHFHKFDGITILGQAFKPQKKYNYFTESQINIMSDKNQFSRDRVAELFDIK